MNEFVDNNFRPDHEIPWAMQLVIHRNKANPAFHHDVLAAAGTAVVRLLDDPRSNDNGEWSENVVYWRSGWIRKIARRAENKRWDDVQQLPGVTVTLECEPETQVRAFVPAPVNDIAPQLKKLQVSGTEMPRAESNCSQSALVDNAPVVTVTLAPGQNLSTGKESAQVGHAAQLAYEYLRDESRDKSVLDDWRADGFRIAVIEPENDWGEFIHDGRQVQVIDAGLTELDGPAETARASW